MMEFAQKMVIKLTKSGHSENGYLEILLTVVDLRLDLGVGVVDDGEEHVHQDEKHQENVRDEIHRALYK